MAQGDADECIQRVIASSAAENAAIDFDRAGDVPQAITKYEECARLLQGAIDAALPAHAEDHPKLVQHRKQILDRVDHLKSLRGGGPTIPLEQQIQAVQLGMQGTAAANAAVSSAGGVKTLGACAAIGAVGGFVVLGGTIGASLSVLGGATAAAYVATRQDGVGDAARKAGSVAVAGAEKAQQINNEHKITEKITDVAQQGAAKAVEVNTKYGITDKVSAGVGAGVSKATEVNTKYDVTNKLASGLSSGLSKLSGALSSSSSAAPGAAASGAAAPR